MKNQQFDREINKWNNKYSTLFKYLKFLNNSLKYYATFKIINENY